MGSEMCIRDSILGKRLNFTWSCDAEPNGNWGHLKTISGPKNSSGAWGGVQGLVSNGTYPMVACTWKNLEHRIGIFDFVVIGSGYKSVVAYYPSASSYDPRLFIRPFVTEVWPLIGAIPLLVMICTFFGDRFAINRSGNNQSRLLSTKLMISIAWISHLLIMANYDGALTMFFTDEITASFESELDILKSYPNWILNAQAASQTQLIVNAEAGNVYYQMYVELMKDDPNKFLYKSVKEGVKRMNSSQIAIYENEKRLRRYYNNNPNETRPTIIPREGDSYLMENFAFTPNSPLVPYFASGCMDLYANGILNILERKWICLLYTSDAADE